MGAWLQILLIVGHSTLFYLIFDTHDGPGSIFIWKSHWNCGKNLVLSPCVLDWIITEIVKKVEVHCVHSTKIAKARPGFDDWHIAPFRPDKFK